MRELVRDYSQFEKIPCPLCRSARFSPELTRADGGTIVRCEDCSHVYVNPTPSDEYLDSIYAQVYTATFEIYRDWFADPNGYHQAVLKLLQTEYSIGGKKVLEIGGGMGFVGNACKNLGAEVVLVEPNPRHAAVAREKFGLKVETATVEAALEKGTLHAGSFDFVIALELIEHVRDPQHFVRSMHQLLKAGGTVVVSTPNYDGFKALGRAFDSVYLYAEHIHFWDPSRLRTLFEKYGYEEVRVIELEKTSAMDLKKISLAKRGPIRAIWGVVRSLPLVGQLKDWFFRRVQSQAEKSGQAASVPLDLVCVGKKK